MAVKLSISTARRKRKLIPKSYKKVSQINYPWVSIKRETRVYSKFVVFHFFGTLSSRPLARLISLHLSGRVDISQREWPGIAARHSKESNVNFIIEILTSRPSLSRENLLLKSSQLIIVENFHLNLTLNLSLSLHAMRTQKSWILEI